ncbi:MAG: hypothetical protein DCC55_11660, partial [Chloroflexi bacterium]
MRSLTLFIGFTLGVPLVLCTLLLSLGRAPVQAIEPGEPAVAPVAAAQLSQPTTTAEISVVVTVGLGPCQQQSTVLEVELGAVIHTCYQVTNLSTVTLVSHTLTDTHFGVLLGQEPRQLAPGDSITHSYETVVTSSFASQAIWKAQDESGEVQAIATAEPITVQVQSTPT